VKDEKRPAIVVKQKILSEEKRYSSIELSSWEIINYLKSLGVNIPEPPLNQPIITAHGVGHDKYKTMKISRIKINWTVDIKTQRATLEFDGNE